MHHLDLERRPVAVRYERSPGIAPRAARPMAACEAVLMASQGGAIRMGVGDSSCRLGPQALRLGEGSAEDRRPPLDAPPFDEEMGSCFIEEIPAVETGGTPPPPTLGDSVILAPLDGADARPDLVLLICNFEQACKLIALAGHEAEPLPRVEMRGASCYRAITYPLLSGNVNVTLMSRAGRRVHGYGAEDLLVSVPVERFERMLEALALLWGGQPNVEIADRLRALLRDRCPGSDN
jgi:uncharacterized protein (DUF169 family)